MPFFYKFDWVKNSLEFLPPMILERCNFSAIFFNENLYVFGGETDHGVTNRCEKFIFKKQ